MALKNSATALSAELPIALMDWADTGSAASVGERPAGVLGAVIDVHDRSGEAAAGAFGGIQGVDDGIGAGRDRAWE